MHGRQYLGVLIVLFLLALPSLQLVHADGGNFSLITVYWGDRQQTEASPGNLATLTVVLRYELDYAFTGLLADLQVTEGFEAVGGGDTVTAPFSGPISSGSIITLNFPLYLYEDLPLGSHTALLTLEYKRSRYVNSVETLAIAVEVTGQPAVRLAALEDNVNEGKQTIWIEVTNTGDAVAHAIEMGDAVASGVSTEFTASTALGDLAPGASVLTPLELIVPHGTRGTILPITIDVSYFGPSHVFYRSTETLRLLVKSTPSLPLNLTLTPNELTIGARRQVNITLMNAGNHTVSNLDLTLSPDANIKILSDQTRFHLASLSPRSSIQVPLEIYVPTTTPSPTAAVTMHVTYFDEAVWLERSETYALNFLLRGLIDISLTDQVVIPAEPRIGSPFSATITITNIGTSVAYAASASPELANLPLKTFGPKSVYIGNIDLNLPTTFTINLQLDNTTEPEILLPVTLTFLDNLRTPYAIVFTIPVRISHETNTSSGTSQGPPIFPFRGTLIIVGLAAIAAVSIVVMWRRKRSRGE